MSENVTTEYPCPECGYDGPHALVERHVDIRTYECGSCYVEFEVPA